MPRTVAPVFRFGFSNAAKTDRFPEKLYEVVADDYLIHWNQDGTAVSVYVDETGFEDAIMECYPGFLQIPNFANFRRLFREYGFDWNNKDSIFEFSHPSFVRGRPEILCNVLTRRKSFYKCKSRNTTPNPLFRNQRDDLDSSDDEVDQPKEPGIMTRRGFIPYKKPNIETLRDKSPEKIKFDEKKAYKIHERPSLIKSATEDNKTTDTPVLEIEEDEETLRKGGFEENKRAIENIINVFAINELSPEEFLEYLELKRSKPISTDNTRSDISPALLPTILKSDKTEMQEVPFQCEFEQQDYTFTQIRPINYQPYIDDILQPKDYHIMETVHPINLEDVVNSQINCTCSCHLVCSQ